MRAILIATILLTSVCYGQTSDQLYKNYVTAIKTDGNFQYFVLVKIKNINTGVIRDVCTQGNFLKGALHKEYGLLYDSSSVNKINQIALNTKDRYFEFKNDSAIKNIADYSIEDLNQVESKINFDSIVQLINKKKEWEYSFRSIKEMDIYAHALLKRGVFTGQSSCRNAVWGPLEYVDPDNLKRTQTKNTFEDTYKKFKNSSCKKDFSKYNDSKEAKDLFCLASFEYSIDQYYSAIDNLKKAYVKGSSAKFKFQILKMIVNAYNKIGDKVTADKYQIRVDKALENMPDIDN